MHPDCLGAKIKSLQQRITCEVRILSVFSRIVGETIERHRSVIYSADVSANIVSQEILNHDQFRAELEGLLNRQSVILEEELYLERDVRLPFILVAAHSTETDEKDAVTLRNLKSWLVETLRHLEWRSLVTSREIDAHHNRGTEGFIGDVPGIGIMIALGNLVSKDELDQIRSAFPTASNRTYPSNSPVKLVSWVLDVPAQRISEAAKERTLTGRLLF
jgi:hypothetical protein